MGVRGRKENTMEHSVLSHTMQVLDESDQRLLQLLAVRRRLAMQLAAASSPPDIEMTLEERVSAVVSRLLRHNPGPLDEARLTALFATVIMLTEPLLTSCSTGKGAPKKG
jgi:chorismate mutase